MLTLKLTVNTNNILIISKAEETFFQFTIYCRIKSNLQQLAM